jgi:hypothetical protein
MSRRVRNIAMVIRIYLKRCGRRGPPPVMLRHFEADACLNKSLSLCVFILEGELYDLGRASDGIPSAQANK